MITDDPNHPGLTHGADSSPVPQADTYLVLSEEERAKGFVRPVRQKYVHAGERPKFPLRDLTAEEHERYDRFGYVKYEEFPEGSPERPGSCVVGRYWTKDRLERKGCGGMTQMGISIAETYARDPKFYGSTYCVHCRMHRPVAEFVWDGTDIPVGT